MIYFSTNNTGSGDDALVSGWKLPDKLEAATQGGALLLSHLPDFHTTL